MVTSTLSPTRASPMSRATTVPSTIEFLANTYWPSVTVSCTRDAWTSLIGSTPVSGTPNCSMRVPSLEVLMVTVDDRRGAAASTYGMRSSVPSSTASPSSM